MFEAAIFDFGGVVTSPIGDAFSRIDDELGLDPGTVMRLMRETREDGEADFHRLEKGTMSEAEYYAALRRRLEDTLGRPIDWPHDAKAVRRLLLGTLRRNEEMLEAVARIAAHHPVGLLTNNVREWGDWRRHYPMEIFRDVVDSSEVGMRKPDPEIYELACRRLGVRPERTVFVDDFEINVDGARAVGMHAILFTTTGEILSELRGLFPKAFA